MPTPEIDIVAYCGRTNTVFAFECKSFLDSYGVNWGELCGDGKDETYKIFRRQKLREMVLGRLGEQMFREGMCPEIPRVILGLVAGKVRSKEESSIKEHFREHGWVFRGPRWIRAGLRQLPAKTYENEIVTVVMKLLRQ